MCAERASGRCSSRGPCHARIWCRRASPRTAQGLGPSLVPQAKPQPQPHLSRADHPLRRSRGPRRRRPPRPRPRRWPAALRGELLGRQLRRHAPPGVVQLISSLGTGDPVARESTLGAGCAGCLGCQAIGLPPGWTRPRDLSSTASARFPLRCGTSGVQPDTSHEAVPTPDRSWRRPAGPRLAPNGRLA